MLLLVVEDTLAYKTTSYSQLEEYEVLSEVFTPSHGAGPGRILSSFNSTCRLAVVTEKMMDLRKPFPSSASRTSALDAVDRINVRWTSTLAPHLRFDPSSQGQSMLVLANHTLFHWCVPYIFWIRAAETNDSPAAVSRSPIFPPPRRQPGPGDQEIAA